MLYTQILPIHCYDFMQFVYCDNLSYRDKKESNNCDRQYTKFAISHNTKIYQSYQVQKLKKVKSVENVLGKPKSALSWLNNEYVSRPAKIEHVGHKLHQTT